MKNNRLLCLMGEIDDKYIESAAPTVKKRKSLVWAKWGALAACLVAVIISGALLIQGQRPEGGERSLQIIENQTAVIWPWEYMTDYERYIFVNFNGNEYSTRSRRIEEKLLGDNLGNCSATGRDYYTDAEYKATFEVRKISGVSEERLIAIGMEGGYYVYMRDNSPLPESFGKALEEYGLAKNLPLCRFTRYEKNVAEGYLALSEDDYIWQVLVRCSDAELLTDESLWQESQKDCLTFSVTSEALGVYKRIFCIGKNGYLTTNIFDEAYICYIGKDAAGKIINYAENNSKKAELEPYENKVCGTITEIGKDYILVDDSVLHNDKKDGTVYKISTSDIRIRRCVEWLHYAVGDTVVVKYDGEISDNNTVNGAYTMVKCKIYEGDALIPE